MIIENVLIVDPIDGEYLGDVILENNIIKQVIIKDNNIKDSNQKDNYQYDNILMPGFIDTHTHGYMGIDFMNSTKTDLKKWAELNFTHGVTRFYPTTVSASIEKLKEVISNFEPILSIKGIHLEGPFINKKKKGAQNENYIYNPKFEYLKDLICDKIKLITMAPELDGFFDVIEYITKHNVVISLGHSDGNYDDYIMAVNGKIKRVLSKDT